MSSEIGWSKEDSEFRRSRIGQELYGFLDNTHSAQAKRREKLLLDVLAWDERRGYILPYKLRDPIRAELGSRD